MEFLDKSLVHRVGDAVSGGSLKRYEFDPGVNIAVGSVLIRRDKAGRINLMLSQGCGGTYMVEWNKSVGGMLLSDIKKGRTEQYYQIDFDGMRCLLRTVTDDEYSVYLNDSAMSDYLYKADGLNVVFVKICPNNIDWSVMSNEVEIVLDPVSDDDVDDIVDRPMEHSTLHANSLFDD